MEKLLFTAFYYNHNNEIASKRLQEITKYLPKYDNKKEKMFISRKVYEYIGSKKPVLSIGYNEGSLKDLIEKTNIGYQYLMLKKLKKLFMIII